MSDIENLKRTVNTARSAHDELLAAVRRGEQVGPSVLGQASREFTSAEAALIAAEEAAELAAKREALLKMSDAEYEAARVSAGFGRGRIALA